MRLALGAAIVLAVASACSPSGVAPETRVDTVVLATLDTTRADHLGVYGYARRPTRRIDPETEEALRNLGYIDESRR